MSDFAQVVQTKRETGYRSLILGGFSFGTFHISYLLIAGAALGYWKGKIKGALIGVVVGLVLYNLIAKNTTSHYEDIPPSLAGQAAK